MRVFIAHTIPSTIQTELAALQNLLRSTNARITWTLPANIHLTLKFLGEIDDKSLDTVIETCQGAIKGTGPFSMGLDAIGVFPNRRQPRVLWVGLKGETNSLVSLARRLNDSLATKGFASDAKPLRPHLTLGRIKSPEAIEAMLSTCVDYIFQDRDFVVDELLVVQSELGRSGSKYTVLSRLPLAGLTSTHAGRPRHQ